MKVMIESDTGVVIEHRDWQWHFDNHGDDVAGDTLYELRENLRERRMGWIMHALYEARSTYMEHAGKEGARSFSLGLSVGDGLVEFESMEDGRNTLSHLPEWVNPEGVLEETGTVEHAFAAWAAGLLSMDLTRDLDQAIYETEHCWMFSRSILDKHPEPEDADGQ